jgi:ferredoxin
VSTIITGAVKNSFGFLVGGEKARMHAVAPRFRDFGELMVDIYQLRVPDLVIMDAVTVMEGNGPSCEDIREEGKMLASRNGIALDTVMAAMMGIDPARVPLLVTAGERGLGPVRVEDIDVRGPFGKIKGFKQPSTVPRMAWTAPFQGLGFRLIARRALHADPGRCTACRTCEKSCPVGAISVDKVPAFDADKCIRCYCCYELCPEHAIVLNRLIRFLQR